MQRGHRAHLLAGDDEVVEAFARLGLSHRGFPRGGQTAGAAGGDASTLLRRIGADATWSIAARPEGGGELASRAVLSGS